MGRRRGFVRVQSLGWRQTAKCRLAGFAILTDFFQSSLDEILMIWDRAAKAAAALAEVSAVFWPTAQ